MKALKHILILSYALVTFMTVDASHPFLMLDFLTIPSCYTHMGLAENRDKIIHILPKLKKSRTQAQLNYFLCEQGEVPLLSLLDFYIYFTL